MSRLLPPEPGSRWVHRDCKRVVTVVHVATLPHGKQTVEYRYESTAGVVAPGRIRRNGGGRRRGTPSQTLSLDDWHRLFRDRAPDKKRA